MGSPEEFVARTRVPLTRALTLFTGDAALGEELAHDALIRAVERWDDVASMARPDGWTFRVGCNLARSWFRSRAAEQRARARVAAQRPASAPDLDRALAVRGAVHALPPRQRAVVIMRYFLDYGVDETAEALGIAPGTVKAHTHKAIEALRRQSDTLRDVWVDD